MRYSCASYDGENVVPAKDADVLDVELEATGQGDGLTSLAIEPKADIGGDGYKYDAARPLQLRVGDCAAMLDTVGDAQVSVAAAASAAAAAP